MVRLLSNKEKLSHSIVKRDMKIDGDVQGRDFREVEQFLGTITKKFMNEPLTLEHLDKEYKEIVGSTATQEEQKNSKVME